MELLNARQLVEKQDFLKLSMSSSIFKNEVMWVIIGMSFVVHLQGHASIHTCIKINTESNFREYTVYQHFF